MIVVCKTRKGISVTGHAGYAEPGNDIVCAAISALTQVFIASVEELTDAKIQYDIEAGDAFIEYRNLTADAQLLEDSFLLGVGMIADEYPEHVQALTT